MHGSAAQADAALVGGTLHSFFTLQGFREGACTAYWAKRLSRRPTMSLCGARALNSPSHIRRSMYQGHTAFACSLLVHGSKAPVFLSNKQLHAAPYLIIKHAPRP